MLAYVIWHINTYMHVSCVHEYMYTRIYSSCIHEHIIYVTPCLSISAGTTQITGENVKFSIIFWG